MKKKLIGTINLTPTWGAILPVLVEVAVNGNAPGCREAAWVELRRLAKIADDAVDTDNTIAAYIAAQDAGRVAEGETP